jgi:hypothetical protein
MAENIKTSLDQLNHFLKDQPWFDFELWEFSGQNLKIVGAIDLTYAYTLSITFSDVFYVQLTHDWHTDTSADAFVLLTGQDAYDLNARYEVEQGYALIQINAEDKAPLFISAKEMHLEFKEIDRVTGEAVQRN